jgi:hypothetical protein
LAVWSRGYECFLRRSEAFEPFHDACEFELERPTSALSPKRIRSDTIVEYARVGCFGKSSKSKLCSGGADPISSMVSASNTNRLFLDLYGLDHLHRKGAHPLA